MSFFSALDLQRTRNLSFNVNSVDNKMQEKSRKNVNPASLEKFTFNLSRCNFYSIFYFRTLLFYCGYWNTIFEKKFVKKSFCLENEAANQ